MPCLLFTPDRVNCFWSRYSWQKANLSITFHEFYSIRSNLLIRLDGSSLRLVIWQVSIPFVLPVTILSFRQNALAVVSIFTYQSEPVFAI